MPRVARFPAGRHMGFRLRSGSALERLLGQSPNITDRLHEIAEDHERALAKLGEKELNRG